MEREIHMNTVRKLCCASLLLLASAALLVLPQFAASPSQLSHAMEHGAQSPDESIPAFHAKAPQGALPPTMAPGLFSDMRTFNAYSLAARIKKVLYQQPCYCRCDRSQGHGSLLDCYVSRHASECDVCQMEDFYAYEQTRKGKTPAQIREGIIRGDWKHVDTSKYAKSDMAMASPPR